MPDYKVTAFKNRQHDRPAYTFMVNAERPDLPIMVERKLEANTCCWEVADGSRRIIGWKHCR